MVNKKTNVWLVIPAWRRYAISDFIFAELQWMRQTLAKQKHISLEVVVIADDKNLDLAKKYGFHAVIQNNEFLGRKFNDGYEYAFNHGADVVVPTGSDSWVHPSYFMTDLWKNWKDDGTILIATRRAIINETGSTMAVAYDDISGGRENKGNLWGYPRSLMKKCNFRPCKEDINSSCDRHTLNSLKKHNKNEIVFVHNNHNSLQTVGFKNRHTQIWPYKIAKDKAQWEFTEFWGRLLKRYPKTFVFMAKKFYSPFDPKKKSNAESDTQLTEDFYNDANYEKLIDENIDADNLLRKKSRGTKEREKLTERKNLLSVIEENITIKTGVVSPSLYASFGEAFLSKFNLEDKSNIYEDSDEPTIYFGCYKQSDIDRIAKNKSKFKILVYGGTDATKVRNMSQIKNISNLYHVAISNFISDDLLMYRIPHKKVPITPIDHSNYDFKANKLGEDIYIYINSEAKSDIYGKDIYTEIMERLPSYKYHICEYRSHSREELIEIYKKCFIGLRLIDHDGLSNTVIEMGIMGRYNIHNGGTPASLPYADIEDVIDHIERQSDWIGRKNIKLSNRIKKYVTLSDEWKTSHFWAKDKK